MKCPSCRGRGCSICSNSGKFILHGSAESNERYTPPFIIEAARNAMNGIDLDPASCALANKIVQAEIYYDYTQNGLIQEWRGNIWCNPPYGIIPSSGKGLQELFLMKAEEEYNTGHAKQIIFLLDAAVVYNPYFRRFFNFWVCFYAGRIEFWNSTEDAIRSRGNVILYMGDYPDRFNRYFSRYGEIVSTLKLGLTNNAVCGIL